MDHMAISVVVSKHLIINMAGTTHPGLIYLPFFRALYACICPYTLWNKNFFRHISRPYGPVVIFHS